MKNWYVSAGLFALVCLTLVCALAFRFVTFDTENYVIVDVPGLQNGEVWQFECKIHDDESQAEFDARIDEAGKFFRASIEAALKDLRGEIVDAVRTKDGMAVVNHIESANRAAEKTGSRIDENLKILYDCEGI